MKDIMGPYQGVMGLSKIPWDSTREWWGYERYHGSLSGGGGAIKDTMCLYQGVLGL